MVKLAQRRSMLFLPDEKRVYFGWKTPTVLALAIDNDIALNHSCGGMGSCGTCRILVESNFKNLPERNEVEREIANDRGFSPQERLACQLRAQDGLIARVPTESLDESK